MTNKGKVLLWLKQTDISENLQKQLSNITFVRTLYKAELLALAPGSDILLILVEINPSNSNTGIDIIGDIRGICREVPIVVFSEHLSPDIINKIIPLDVYDYIIAPFTAKKISGILTELTNKIKGKENYNLLYNLSEKFEQLSVENEIITLLNTTTDLKTVLKIIIQKAITLVNVKAASILLFNDARSKLVFSATYGEKSSTIKGKELSIGQGIAGWVAKHGEPVLTNNVTADERFYNGIDRTSNFITRSILCAPIEAENTIHGVIELVNKLEGDFVDADLEKIETLAFFAAFALHKSNLIKREKKRVEEITLLFEIGTYLSSMLDLDELLQQSVQLIRRSFGFYYIAIALVNSEKLILELKSFDSEEQVTPKRRQVPIDRGLMGSVVKSGIPLRVGNVKKDKRYLKGIGCVKSEMVIPLKRKDTILGVMDIGSKKLNAFNHTDQVLTEQISRFLSISIENAMLYKKVGMLALIDDLTGLYNARYCHITLAKLNKKRELPFSIIFLDLDFFKLVNDQFGHQTGGVLLREVADILKQLSGKGITTIRYGGDEYVVILSGIKKEAAMRVAEKIAETLKRTKFLADLNLNYHITASLGISSYPSDATNGEEVLRFADRAMYWVKNHGRNSIKAYDQDVSDLSEYPL